MKTKKWKYHTSIGWVDGKDKFKLLTQLYEVGVYAIFYKNDIYIQSSNTPSQIQKKEKQLLKELEKLNIKPEFGRLITVTTDENGFYKED